MSQLVISNLELFEDISNQISINGGSRRYRGIDAALDAELDASLDAGLTIQGRLGGRRRVSAFAEAAQGSAAASAVAVGGGRARASASVEL